MRPFWRLAMLPAFLFACAQAAPPLQVQMLEPVCESASRAEIKEAFAQGGVAPTVELEGEQVEELRAWLDEYTDQPIPPADGALIFVTPNGQAMIVWFDNDCMISHGKGPWEPLARHLGILPGSI